MDKVEGHDENYTSNSARSKQIHNVDMVAKVT